uniref:Large ribosomal subunit protein uL29m n=1 Tax=Grammatophora oceanica TaxID=210454 RepID=A0A7S1UQV1_9STRA|mmetsp:Transcript_13811/g.20220  ORF Transcript_13811/g.20220 Transcript_13811/m.20220 type:complete len:263 (+) Transcript_13811:64-852(+)
MLSSKLRSFTHRAALRYSRGGPPPCMASPAAFMSTQFSPNKYEDDSTYDHERPSRAVGSLREFRDSVSTEERRKTPVGNQWHARHLRRKSYEDLHKLWWVLYKEKNMLYTESNLYRRNGVRFPQPDRLKKVKKSMGAIRQVLGERKRAKIAADKLVTEEGHRLAKEVVMLGKLLPLDEEDDDMEEIMHDESRKRMSDHTDPTGQRDTFKVAEELVDDRVMNEEDYFDEEELDGGDNEQYDDDDNELYDDDDDDEDDDGHRKT